MTIFSVYSSNRTVATNVCSSRSVQSKFDRYDDDQPLANRSFVDPYLSEQCGPKSQSDLPSSHRNRVHVAIHDRPIHPLVTPDGETKPVLVELHVNLLPSLSSRF